MSGSFRRLRVLKGRDPNDGSWNLFARLSPKTAFQLQRDARAAFSESTENVDDSIDFLPLELQLCSGELLYVSYNGGICDLEDTIDIPESLLPDPSVSAIAVRALQSLEAAVHITLEPVEYDDWVLIEAHATWLENGGLLQQVTVVYPNQILLICLDGRDWARVKVLSSQQKDGLWPEVDSLPPCYKLMEDTEVLVTPKRRPEAPPVQLCLFPCAQDYDSATIRLAKLLNYAVVEVPRHCAVAHPSIQLMFDEGCEQEDVVSVSYAESRSTCLVSLLFDERIPEGSLALHPCVRSQMKLGIKDSIIVKKVTRLELEALNVTEGIGRGLIRCNVERVDQLFVYADASHRYPVSIQECRRSFMCCQTTKVPPRSAPIQSGCVLQIPVGTEESLESELFRFTIVSGTDPEKVCGAFIPLSDLTEMLENAFITKTEKHDNAFVQLISARLLAVLDDSTCFFSNWVRLCQDIVKQPSVIIYGPRGTGKSTLASLVASIRQLKSGCPSFYLDCGKLKDTRGIRMSEILADLQRAFTDFMKIAGATLILDDVHHLIRDYSKTRKADDSSLSFQVSTASVEQAKLVSDVVRQLVLQFQAASNDSMVIITCEDCGDVPESVVSAGGFNVSISPPPLTIENRVELLSRLLGRPGSRKDANHGYIQDLCRRMEEFRPIDLKRFALRLQENPGMSLSDFIPMSRMGMEVDDSSNKQTWSDVGGLFIAKKELASAVLRPSKYKRIYQRTDVKLPRGILLFGPPGCGKTFLLPALARECGLNLVTCRGPELLDKYIGASEAKVRELFARAAASTPCLLFLDELDSLAPKRGSDHTGVTDRVVNQLLTFLDGVEDASDGGTIFIIGASSRPDKIDSALLRPGRLERHVYIGLPENTDELSDMINAISRSFRLEKRLQQDIEKNHFAELLLRRCPQASSLSAADINAAFVTAQVSAVHHLLALGVTSDAVEIGETNLIQAFVSLRPSIADSSQRQLHAIYASFRKSRASPLDPREGSSQPSYDSLRVALR